MDNDSVFGFSIVPQSSASRVMALMQLPEPLTGDMGIDLCRRQITVPQQHLYDTQVSTVVYQVCGKRMS